MNKKIEVKQLKDHIYLLRDKEGATGYLVVGQKKALVIDTMHGYDNVHDVVRTLTDLPFMVVNTHGHCDHIYGNIYFEEAYIHPDDKEIVEEHIALPDFVEACKAHNLSMPPFNDISDGDVIELGGLTLDVISLPGHTPGGICLLLREDRILFTGDGINHHLWMQLEESSKLEDLLKHLDKIMYVTNDADYILHGHAKGFDDISLLTQLRDGVADLIKTRGAGDKDYEWFGGVDKQHIFGDGESVICYSIDKL
ncbi:MAG: MBL fold metallo-hydrolase [Candidatus Galacturonibacter soehngenii]|nr:MBL fold metallo-hydrolase [Candidatus Galacturonibacter soehngenii]